MTIRRADLDNVYKAVERYCGANMTSIVAIWGTGTNSSRTYYVVVNHPGMVSATTFQVIQVTLTPNTVPSYTASTVGGWFANANAAHTAAIAAFTALTGVTESTPIGPLVW